MEVIESSAQFVTLVASALQAAEKLHFGCSVTGHDFSRADKADETNRALAPAEVPGAKSLEINSISPASAAIAGMNEARHSATRTTRKRDKGKASSRSHKNEYAIRSILMRVAFTPGHFFNRDDATFQLLAANMLELNCRVTDLEMVLEHMVQLYQDACALRRWNIGNGHVARQGAGLRTEAPDVEVVHVDHALDIFHAGANIGERNASRCAFQQDVQTFADDADAGPQDEGCDEQRKHGIDPVVSGDEDSETACNDGGCR